jgi:hypothetical protein
MVLRITEDRIHDKRVDELGFAAPEIVVRLVRAGILKGFEASLERFDPYFKHGRILDRPLWPAAVDELLKGQIHNLREEKAAIRFFSTFATIDKWYFSQLASRLLGKDPHEFATLGRNFKPYSKKVVTDGLSKGSSTCWIARVIDTNMLDTLCMLDTMKPGSELNVIYQSPRPLVEDLAPKESQSIRFLSDEERDRVPDFSKIECLTAYRHLKLYARTLIAARFVARVYDDIHFHMRMKPMTCRAHISEANGHPHTMTYLRHAAFTAGLLAPGMMARQDFPLYERLKHEALDDRKPLREQEFPRVLNDMSSYEKKIQDTLLASIESIPAKETNSNDRNELLMWKDLLLSSREQIVNQVTSYEHRWEASGQDLQSCKRLVGDLANVQETTRKIHNDHIRKLESIFERHHVEVTWPFGKIS